MQSRSANKHCNTACVQSRSANKHCNTAYMQSRSANKHCNTAYMQSRSANSHGLIIYVSLVAWMSVGRVLTHSDICACLIRVRGTTWAWPNPLRLPYPCCHTLLYTPQTLTPCPIGQNSGCASQLIRDLPPYP